MVVITIEVVINLVEKKAMLLTNFFLRKANWFGRILRGYYLVIMLTKENRSEKYYLSVLNLLQNKGESWQFAHYIVDYILLQHCTLFH